MGHEGPGGCVPGMNRGGPIPRFEPPQRQMGYRPDYYMVGQMGPGEEYHPEDPYWDASRNPRGDVWNPSSAPIWMGGSERMTSTSMKPCFALRDRGSCFKGKDCPYSHVGLGPSRAVRRPPNHTDDALKGSTKHRP